MLLKRREFLRAVVISAGALVVGCGPKDEDPNNGQNNGTTGSNNGTTGGTNNGNACEDQLEPGAQFFPQSVASGDPTSSSVILWTRVEDGDGDIELELQVALDAEFTQRLDLGEDGCSKAVTAPAAYDNCVKVRLTDLDAGTHYYYRFVYEKDGTRYTTNVGRTKTAPAADADVAAKFAFVSCQDISGKYYNVYKQLTKDESLDFVVHLGDYVYETTGDPQFQETTPDRVVTFRDPAGAIVFNEGTDREFYAAKSLSNYRDLYRAYRGDASLQRAHELYPFVVIWDDHEFSDDCYGATATYFDGRQDETDEQRRKNANQAWYEYMPVDYLDDPDFAYDANATYGEDITIYRDIRWGAHTHLVMTDLRSYRADHLIPEDLFPGTTLMTQAELEAAEGELPDWADPYVDIETYDGGSYATLLTGAAATVGYDAADVTGNISVTYINAIVDATGQGTLIDPTTITDRGLTAISIGKTSPTGSLGARYFVVKEPYQAWARAQYAATSGASETVMGEAQEAWFLDTMKGSDATWKVWGNEFTLSQRAIDLTSLGAVVGDAFAKVFLLSAEDWDGLPNRRDALIDELADVGGVVAITGDIHAFFSGTPFVSSDRSKRIIEFVTGAVSSGSYKTLLTNTVNSDPALVAAGADALVESINNFLFVLGKPNPPLAFGNVQEHGYAVVRASGTQLECTFQQIAESVASQDMDAGALDAEFEGRVFYVKAGESNLYSNIGGGEKRWDPETIAWVD